MAKMQMELTYIERGEHVKVLTNYVNMGNGMLASYVNEHGDILTLDIDSIVCIEAYEEDED